MKYIFIFITVIFCHQLEAQQNEISIIYVNEHVSTHFICSESVQYVDISTNQVVGDIPLSNVVRIRPKEGSEDNPGIVTIIAEQYIIQYQMKYTDAESADKKIFISQPDGQSLMLPEITMTYEEMRSFSLDVLQTKTRKTRQRKRTNGIEVQLNKIYTVGGYYLLDLSFRNRTKIPYDIDQIRFKIEDKKITKATNIQSIEIKPEFQFYHMKGFKKQYRNVFIFRKFTFPNKKVFTIELAEKQISGRNLTLKIDYKDVLNADVL